MNVRPILLCSLLLFIASCDNDDDPENVSIVGTWNAVSLTTSESFDFNGDGEASNDIFEEVPCFSSTTTFNADGSLSSTTSNLEFTTSGDAFMVQCDGSSSYTGTYKLEGNSLTTSDEEGDVTSNITLTNNQLVVTGETADFGNATIVFERQ